MTAFWSEFLLPAAGPVAILVAALVAWKVQTRIAIRRATMDFISKHEIGNPRWEAATREFGQLTAAKADPNLLSLLDPGHDPDLLQRRLLVASMLNHYEAVAVAIKRGVMSEDIYKDWSRSNYVDAWQKADAYVTERRRTAARPTAYVNFERLAEKWAKEPPEPN